MALSCQCHRAAPFASSSRHTSVKVVCKATTKQRKGNVGFKWDPANSRWVRDDRFAGLASDESKTLIQPKTGSAYQVCQNEGEAAACLLC